MYVQTLLETRRPLASGGSLGTGAVSFAFHATLIAAVIYGSLHPKAIEDVGRLIVDVPLYEAPAQRPADLPVFVRPPVTFNALAIPTNIPTFIPPPSREAFDPTAFSGIGAVASPFGRDTATRRVASVEEVYVSEVLEERPVRIAGAAPRYPDLLRAAGINGRVRLEFVLDTTGAIERGSARVLESSHELFGQAALEVVESWRFRPGRIDGRAVRVRVRMPVDFVKVPS